MGLLSWLGFGKSSLQTITPERAAQIKASNEVKIISAYSRQSKKAVEQTIPVLSAKISAVDYALTKSTVTHSYAGDTQNEIRRPFEGSINSYMKELKRRVANFLSQSTSIINGYNDVWSWCEKGNMSEANNAFTYTKGLLGEHIHHMLTALDPIQNEIQRFLSSKSPIGRPEVENFNKQVKEMKLVLERLKTDAMIQ